MAYNRLQLRQLIIDNLEDYPQRDALAAAISTTTGLTFTATDYTKYNDGSMIEFASGERAQVNGTPSTSTITVIERGFVGTTAATQANGTLVRIGPEWFAHQINSKINDCLTNRVLKKVEDNSAITLTASTYIYDLPAAIKADRLIGNPYMRNSDNTYDEQEIRKWKPKSGSGTSGVDQIEFYDAWTAGRKIHLTYKTGYTAFSDDTTASTLPDNETAQLIPVYWACYDLLGQKATPPLKRDRTRSRATSAELRLNVSRDWLQDFISACYSAGLITNIVGAGYPMVSSTRVGI